MKQIKTIIAILFAVALLPLCSCTGGNRGTETDAIDSGSGANSGNAGDEIGSQGLDYKNNGNGTCTITGIGTCTDTDVIIPAGIDNLAVVEIGEKAFEDCAISSVTIPESVTGIGLCAFFGCTSLKSISVPGSVTSIGNSAFYGCTSLESVTLPDGLTKIGLCTFLGCTSLTSISIPGSVTSIDSRAFEGCAALTSIAIPAGVTNIGKEVFSGCTSLESVTVPDEVTSIGKSAFSGCTSLTSISIPDGITSIGNEAFKDCTSLTSISIPDSVTGIDSDTFSGCDSLVVKWKVTDLAGFCGNSHKCGANWECYLNGLLVSDLALPDGVKEICGSAFYGCTSLSSVSIPDSVTSIGNCAFDGCTSLTSISIPGSVTSIGASAFYGCTSLISITISDGVKTIGTGAFTGCASLTSVTIPASVTDIGIAAFLYCSRLTDINYSGTKAQWRYLSSVLLFYDDCAPTVHCLDGDCPAIDNAAESIVSESINPGEKIALVINGKNITDDNYVNYNNEYDCFELPLIAILKELGAEIKWLDEKTVSIIIYDKTYVLNTEECSLTEINSTFNLFQIAPGDTHGVFSKRVENEFVIDSDSLKLFFINELGLRMRRSSNNKEITIDDLNGR